MNNVIDKFLLTSDKLMPEMCLKQPGFRYGKCGPFMKNKEYKKIRETSNFGYVFHNEIKLVFNMIWLVVHIKI